MAEICNKKEAERASVRSAFSSGCRDSFHSDSSRESESMCCRRQAVGKQLSTGQLLLMVRVSRFGKLRSRGGPARSEQGSTGALHLMVRLLLRVSRFVSFRFPLGIGINVLPPSSRRQATVHRTVAFDGSNLLSERLKPKELMFLRF